MPKTQQTKLKRTPSRFKRLPRGANGGIELLLIQSIESLGEPGDVIEVKPGYAKNYLLPQGLATFATEHHKRMVDKHRSKLLAIEEQRMSTLRAYAAEIAKQSVTIEANANNDGHLYGSVGATEIAAALKKNDINVNEDQVRLQGPLKELGLYTVGLHVGKDIDAELKVWVVPTAGGSVEEPAAASE